MSLAIATFVCASNAFSVLHTVAAMDFVDPAMARAGGQPLQLSLGELPGTSAIRLQVRASAQGVMGDRGRSGLFLVPVDRTGASRWQAADRIARMRGTVATRDYGRRAFLESDFRGYRLVAVVDASAGAIAIDHVRLDLLGVRPFYRIAEPCLIVLWLTLAAAVAGLMVRSAQRRIHAIVAAVVAAMFYAGTVMPASYVRVGSAIAKCTVEAVHARVAECVASRSSGEIEWHQHRDGLGKSWPIEPEKLVHLGLSSILALLVRRAFPRSSLAASAAYLLCAVAGTELVQMMTPDRDSSLSDVAIDALGLMLGLAAAETPARRPPWLRSAPSR